MSDVEFVGKMNPQPFESFDAVEKGRLNEVRQRILRDKLKDMGRQPPPESEPEYTREPFIE
jgi:hypothetical protein